MYLTLIKQRQWFRKVLILCLLVLCIFPGSTYASAGTDETGLSPRTTAVLAPNLRAVLFDKVALLPFLVDDPQLTDTLTSSFFTALSETKKYDLLPLDTVTGWQHARNVSDTTLQEMAVTFGRTLKARGVISADIHIKQTRSLQTGKPVSSLVMKIRMTDTQTGKTAWTLHIKSNGPWLIRQLNMTQAKSIMRESLQILLRKMVQEGDIFSPLLPAPMVISSKGDLRKIRVILQPDPQYLYEAYQLLTSDNERGVFIPHAAPVKNSRSSIVLEETGLKDGRRYFCTVIGLTRKGLANIPRHPFMLTTSGAPAPLPSLQASGNNLRHIQLLWPPSQDPHVTGYSLYRSTTQDGPFLKIADITDRNQQSFTDYGQNRSNYYGSLADNTRYFYTIRTRNKYNIESKGAPVVSAKTKGAPLPPTEIRAIGNQPGKIPLFWVPGEDPDIKGYAIYRNENNQGIFQQIDFVSGRDTQSYTDTGSWLRALKNNHTYSYQIRSVNVLDLSSKASTTVSATTKPAPTAVQKIHASQNVFRQVRLQWQPNPENDIVGYVVYRGQTRDDLKRIAEVDAAQTDYTDNELRDGSTYWFQVQAIDSDKLKGDLAPPVSATTKPGPRAPSGVQARITPRGILLKWQKGHEKDIDHYEISTPGFLASKLGETSNNAFLYKIQPTQGKTYKFLIRTVDKDGLASNFSRQITIHIPKH